MIAHIVAIPTNKDLEYLNSLRLYIYENDFRFNNKSSVSDTHITLSEVSLEDTQIQNLEESIKNNIFNLKTFAISKEEWTLTNEPKEPNYRSDQPYTWIALKFPQRKDLYLELERVTNELGINNNEEYIKNVKRIEEHIKDSECLANHMNLSNYTRREKADECWNYFNNKLRNQITFDKIALRSEDGRLLLTIPLSQ